MRVARRAKSRPTSKSENQDARENHSPQTADGRTPLRAFRRLSERRAFIRVRLALPVCVRRVAGQPSAEAEPLRLRDISSSGAFFSYPRRIEPSTPVALEVSLFGERPSRRAVRMCVDAHVVRAEPSGTPGWHGLAVAFDDIRYVRNALFATPAQLTTLPSS
jgi:hypothetical protein